MKIKQKTQKKNAKSPKILLHKTKTKIQKIQNKGIKKCRNNKIQTQETVNSKHRKYMTDHIQNTESRKHRRMK